MKINKLGIAGAAAALFTLGVAGESLAGHHEAGEGEKVQCTGVNGCKGQGECKTAKHECGGMNECKGKGWVYMTDAECKKAKAAKKS